MKVVILAGGLGTRLSEETALRPKPMVEVGGNPILWHIMKIYASHGLTDFVVCCGYRGYVIKEYFANYFLHTSDVTFDLAKNSVEVHHKHAEPWKVTLIDTGADTQTGGRLKRVGQYIGDDDFCFTYGDGVGDIDITASIAYHRQHGRMATVTGARPLGRFGTLSVDGDRVMSFKEKPPEEGGWINAGFFVLSPRVLDYIEQDATVWEGAPIERLAKEDQLRVHYHNGFWQPMDTLRDKNYLEDLWWSGRAPWKRWT
ncbi:glucose-1-phosphate cytidylyltransferase [Herbaspirillum sp. BH-1]|uniref:Glucose-1-phosphate cytidylyltransferase n=2 Tax=Herbaspirillum frisingense TaxID=92645 RepID=A0AAI9IIP4_9BURK|nr:MULTISPECIES: glucose-1-phosphate cytidylyltransferase [Herbaspirillum]EOA06805.1 Glucose-1-phosphate cytidylyltransferase [Herbaspirillum frisingense GSF30]MCI1016454.1 glucose-1-phosphate cytidylyltransferase [Herbaspirillum sp. C7C2]MDR6584348.1 glucose-1-phosphate cytidylyltransferase [Herbaspirillum frisingense]ONN67022.1 glucose-1-phosphate cytidylyltransferase [Herbaspirillum sp. VT-16-41]PLY59592.1 glucose-1-phosphate cytidylyltransferase [Herbaspirillum sp. BH-1]